MCDPVKQGRRHLGVAKYLHPLVEREVGGVTAGLSLARRVKAPITTLPRLARRGSAGGVALLRCSGFDGISWARSAERWLLGISRAAKGGVQRTCPLMSRCCERRTGGGLAHLQAQSRRDGAQRPARTTSPQGLAQLQLPLARKQARPPSLNRHCVDTADTRDDLPYK